MGIEASILHDSLQNIFCRQETQRFLSVSCQDFYSTLVCSFQIHLNFLPTIEMKI